MKTAININKLKHIASDNSLKSTKSKDIYKQKSLKDSKALQKEDTSWHSVADWYSNHLKEEDTYHNKVVKPNLFRILENIKGKTVLDLACGNGYFSYQLASEGAKVIGVDAGRDLIKIAKDNLKNLKTNPSKGNNLDLEYFVSDAGNLGMIDSGTIDIAICSLAIQNIEDVGSVMKEVYRVLKSNGRMIIIMNHPVLRTPKISHWGYDKTYNIQYRRLDAYMTESKNKIDMNPGEADDKKKNYTYSFHRPLQYYFKIFNKNKFAVTKLEEWNSHKKSQNGPKQKAEDRARSEFPMFLALEIKKI